MQMKMDKKSQKFDKQSIRQILEVEDEFISTLFDSFEVPDSIEGNQFHFHGSFQDILYNFGIFLNVLFVSSILLLQMIVLMISFY